jgi:hypothetical protein
MVLFKNNRMYGKKSQQKNPNQIRRTNRYQSWNTPVWEECQPRSLSEQLQDWIEQIQDRVDQLEPICQVQKMHKSRGFSAGLKELDMISTPDHTDYADFDTIRSIMYGIEVIIPPFQEFLQENYPNVLATLGISLKNLVTESAYWSDRKMISTFETETSKFFSTTVYIMQSWTLICQAVRLQSK